MVSIILAKENLSKEHVLSASDADLTLRGNEDYEVKFLFVSSNCSNVDEVIWLGLCICKAAKRYNFDCWFSRIRSINVRIKFKSF
jgi:hypothetical protein